LLLRTRPSLSAPAGKSPASSTLTKDHGIGKWKSKEIKEVEYAAPLEAKYVNTNAWKIKE
jgi:hypothetical protein